MTEIEGPTPQINAYLIKVCNFVGPATPILTGRFIFSFSKILSQFFTGSRSKQNWVVIPNLILVVFKFVI